MKYNSVSLLITSLVFLFSCSNTYVISPEKLEDVLVDLHIAEGIAVEKGSSFKTIEDKLDLYNFVYEKHGIDKALFDSTIHYYSLDTYALSDIYENVYARILALEKEVKNVNFAISAERMSQRTYNKMIGEDRDLIANIRGEYWSENRTLIFDETKFEEGVSFDFDIDTLLGNKLELRFAIKSNLLTSAKCTVTSLYDTDEEVKTFELPTDSTELVVLDWAIDKQPNELKVNFSAIKAEDEASLRFDYFRLYQLSDTKHSTHIFN